MSSQGQGPNPALSVVVVIHNMRREAARTLFSLSPGYQKEIDPAAYEVVVVENGSSQPLPRAYLESLGDNFQYFYLSDASPSPAAAMNFGSRQSRSKHICCMVDGARMVTPRMLGLALRCLEAFPRPVVGTLGFHLGPDVQNRAREHRYGQAAEDELLAGIGWPEDGYRLFEIATLALSSRRGWFACLYESNCAFLPRSLFEELNGFEEAFDAPGGGLVNLDFWRRACELQDSTVINLLGEGSFHQIHSGAATSRSPQELNRMFSEWELQYRQIRGRAFANLERTPLIVGHPHPAALAAAPAIESGARFEGHGSVNQDTGSRESGRASNFPFLIDERFLSRGLVAKAEEFALGQPFPHIVLERFLPERHANFLARHFPGPDHPVWLDWRKRSPSQYGKQGPGDSENFGLLASAFVLALQEFNGWRFLTFLEALTGIQRLIPDPYFTGGGIHQIVRDGILDIHTDFNEYTRLGLYRRVNVLIFLTEEWNPSYGGCLELWDGGAETGSCAKAVAPLFNRAVIFKTDKQSFHGHTEPWAAPGDLTRRSIALYYYTSWREKGQAYDTNTDFQGVASKALPSSEE